MKKEGQRYLICILILSLVVVLGGCSPQPAAAPAPAKPAAEPIHIGVLGPMTGWATVYGENVVKGVQLALDEVGGKFQDRPIQLHIEDTKAEVETMITKFDSLKQRDNCKLIIGPSLGHEGDATPDWAKKNLDVLVMPGYAAPQDMTMRDHTPNYDTDLHGNISVCYCDPGVKTNTVFSLFGNLRNSGISAFCCILWSVG